jgi:hypothetical protein
MAKRYLYKMGYKGTMTGRDLNNKIPLWVQRNTPTAAKAVGVPA